MTREAKVQLVDDLTTLINENPNIYLTNISGLDAQMTSDLRRNCFKSNISLIVVKNTLFKRAMDNSDKKFEDIYEVLKGNTSVMFSESSKAPAQIIKEFRKKTDKPILKAAYVEESVYMGDDQLDILVNIKSKEEVIADIIGLLQLPVKNVLSALQSGKNKLSGIVTALSDK